MPPVRLCRRAVALFVTFAMIAPAAAAPRKVLVLPLDGDADAATRARLSASVQRLARVLEGDVQPGTATFVDTAAAVGCDPATPDCVEEVRATLGVDELVYGTANTEDGQVNLVVKRAGKDVTPREITATVDPGASPDQAEREILPVFNNAAAPPPPDVPPNGDIVAPPVPVETRSRRQRNIGIVATAGGGTMFLIGLLLWSSAGGLQDDIDEAETDTSLDFVRLTQLEDQMSSRAWAGNLLVLGGLALGAYGGWLLYKDRQSRVTVTPVPIEGGAAITLTLIGGGL